MGIFMTMTRPGKQEELATAAESPDRFWSKGMEIYNPDDLDGHDSIRKYRRMEKREVIIRAGLRELEKARIAQGSKLVEGEGPRAAEMFDYTSYVLENIQGTERDLIRELMEALWAGFSLIEKVPFHYKFGPHQGKVGYKKFSAKWQENFILGIDEFGNLTHIKQDTARGGRVTFEGAKLKRFIVYTPNRRKGNWYGDSILRPLYRPYVIKDHCTRYMARGLEKHGSGSLVFTGSPDGQTYDQAALNAKAAQLNKTHGSNAFALAPGEDLEFVFPPGDVADGLVKAIQFLNTEMMIGLSLPQTLWSGTGSDGSGGSLALAVEQRRNFSETIDRIGVGIEDVINEQVITAMLDWNWNDVLAAERPKWKFNPWLEEDAKAGLERLEKAAAFGVPISMAQIREVSGALEPKDAADVAQITERLTRASQGPSPAAIAEFQEDQLKLSREMTAIESKVDWEKVARRDEDATRKFVNDLAPIMADIRDRAIARAKTLMEAA